MEKVYVHKQFSLKVKDFLKGIYIAVIVPALVSILEVIQSGSFDLDFKSLGIISVSSLAAYLLKNFFQTSQVVVVDPEKSTEFKSKLAMSSDDGGVHPPSNPIHPKRPVT